MSDYTPNYYSELSDTEKQEWKAQRNIYSDNNAELQFARERVQEILPDADSVLINNMTKEQLNAAIFDNIIKTTEVNSEYLLPSWAVAGKNLKTMSDEEREEFEEFDHEWLNGATTQEKSARLERLQFRQYLQQRGFDAETARQIQINTPEEQRIQYLFDEAYSPYGKNGQIVPGKGVGNEATYNRLNSMSPEAKNQLLHSNYKTGKDLEEAVHKGDWRGDVVGVVVGAIGEYITARVVMAELGVGIFAAGAAAVPTLGTGSVAIGAGTIATAVATLTFGSSLTTEAATLARNAIQHNEEDIAANEEIANDIYNADQDKKMRQDNVLQYKQSVFNTIANQDPEEIDKLFKQYFNPDIDDPNAVSLGDGVLQAWNTANKLDYTDAQKRSYIATYQTAIRILGLQGAKEYMERLSLKGVTEDEGLGHWARSLGSSLLITFMSRLADTVGGVRTIYNKAADTINPDTYSIYMDKNGTVYPTKAVIEDSSGSYIQNGQTKIPVYKREYDRSTLYMLGVDSDGEKLGWFLNPLYWEAAGMYNTFDEEELEAYKKYGYSPHTYHDENPNSIGNITYSALNMSAFTAFDLTLAAVTRGLGKATGISKALNRIPGKTGQVSRGIADTVIPFSGAVSIGQAYGRSAFLEMFASNQEKFEIAVEEQAKQNIKDKYNTNSDYRDSLQDKLTKLRNESNNNSEYSTVFTDDELMMIIVKEEVENEVQRLLSDDANTKKLQEEAAKDAMRAAAIISFTEAFKYNIINIRGFMRYFYKGTKAPEPGSIQAEVAKLDHNANGFIKSAKDNIKMRTLKSISYMAGNGAVTNWTDELQVGGGKQVNEDAFTNAITGLYKLDSDNLYYNASYNLVTSFLSGAWKATGTSRATQAGLVGALGSAISFAPNVVNIGKLMGSKSFRKEWKEMTSAEKINTVVNIGFLNPYIEETQKVKAINAAVDQVNSWLKDIRDQNVIGMLGGLHIAADNAVTTTEQERDALKLLATVIALQELDTYDVRGGSSIVTNIKSVITKLVNNEELTDTERSYVLEQYYAKNQNKIVNGNKNPEGKAKADEEALSILKENAIKLNKYLDIYATEKEKAESEIQEKDVAELDHVTLKQARQTRAMQNTAKQLLLDEIDNISQEVNGKKVSEEDETSVGVLSRDVYGSAESIKKHREAAEASKATVDEKLEEINKKLEELDPNQHPELYRGEEASNTENLNKFFILHRQKSFLENRQKSIDTIIERLQTLEDSQDGFTVISKDDIINKLSATDRGFLFISYKNNKQIYSKEQQDAIEAAMRELGEEKVAKSMLLYHLIQTYTYTKQLTSLDKKDFITLLEDAYNSSLENLNDRNYYLIWSSLNTAFKEATDRWKKREPTVTPEQIQAEIIKEVKKLLVSHQLSTDILQYLVDNFEHFDQFQNILSQISQLLETRKQVDKIRFTLLKTKNEAFKKLSENDQNSLMEKFNEVTTKEELQTVIEELKSDKIYAPVITELLKTEAAIKEVMDLAHAQSKFNNSDDKDSNTSPTSPERLTNQPADPTKSCGVYYSKYDLTAATHDHVWKERDNPGEPVQSVQSIYNNQENFSNDTNTVTQEQLEDALDEVEREDPTIKNSVANIRTAIKNSADNSDVTQIAKDAIDQEIQAAQADTVKKKLQKIKDKIENTVTGQTTNDVQDIIDFELGKIEALQSKPTVHYLINKADKEKIFLAVKYTDQVKKIHKKKRGCVVSIINSDGTTTEYLIIGNLGYGATSGTEAGWNQLRIAISDNINQTTNWDQATWAVSETYTTEITKIDHGQVIQNQDYDPDTHKSTPKVVSVNELLNGTEEQNPHKLQSDQLKFGIATQDQGDLKLIGLDSDAYQNGQIVRVNQQTAGKVYMFLPTASNKWFPIQLSVTKFQDIKKSSDLYNILYNAFRDLLSSEKTKRDQALDTIQKYLVVNIKTEQGTITINFENNVLIIKRNNDTLFQGTVGNLDSINNISQFINSESFNPMMQLSELLLSSHTEVANLLAADVLRVNIDRLALRGANYTLHNPVTVVNSTLRQKFIKGETSTLQITSRSVNKQLIKINGKEFETDDNGTYMGTINQIPVHDIAMQLQNATPECTQNGTSYYIITVNGNEIGLSYKDGDYTFVDTTSIKKLKNKTPGEADLRPTQKTREDQVIIDWMNEPQITIIEQSDVEEIIGKITVDDIKSTSPIYISNRNKQESKQRFYYKITKNNKEIIVAIYYTHYYIHTSSGSPSEYKRIIIQKSSEKEVASYRQRRKRTSNHRQTSVITALSDAVKPYKNKEISESEMNSIVDIVPNVAVDELSASETLLTAENIAAIVIALSAEDSKYKSVIEHLMDKAGFMKQQGRITDDLTFGIADLIKLGYALADCNYFKGKTERDFMEWCDLQTSCHST